MVSEDCLDGVADLAVGQLLDCRLELGDHDPFGELAEGAAILLGRAGGVFLGQVAEVGRGGVQHALDLRCLGQGCGLLLVSGLLAWESNQDVGCGVGGGLGEGLLVLVVELLDILVSRRDRGRIGFLVDDFGELLNHRLLKEKLEEVVLGLPQGFELFLEGLDTALLFSGLLDFLEILDGHLLVPGDSLLAGFGKQEVAQRHGFGDLVDESVDHLLGNGRAIVQCILDGGLDILKNLLPGQNRLAVCLRDNLGNCLVGLCKGLNDDCVCGRLNHVNGCDFLGRLDLGDGQCGRILGKCAGCDKEGCDECGKCFSHCFVPCCGGWGR